MAYFRCSVGSGKNDIPLIVTCSSDFAGTTITCTDGTTTLTNTCPSSSPYEITFKLPNAGTWTVSGTVSGTSYSESILVQDLSIDLLVNVDISVDVYSAANDTVSYTGLDGQTHTITTDSSGHASATITIDAHGSSITFTSNVAKNPDNLSNDYSKSISLTPSTSSIYVMPDGEIVYWYGYRGSNLQDCTSANGWSFVYGLTDPTYNTNSISISNVNDSTSAISKNAQVSASKVANIICSSTNLISNTGLGVYECNSKTIADANVVQASQQAVTGTIEKKSITFTSTNYVIFGGIYKRNGVIYGAWIE